MAAIETVLIKHPVLIGQTIRINRDQYDPAVHKLADAAVAPSAPAAPSKPAEAPLKTKVLAYDKGLGTPEGLTGLNDPKEWPNARAKELADLIGMEYGMLEKGDSIRERLVKAVAQIVG